jgi:hypothetical protein
MYSAEECAIPCISIVTRVPPAVGPSRGETERMLHPVKTNSALLSVKSWPLMLTSTGATTAGWRGVMHEIAEAFTRAAKEEASPKRQRMPTPPSTKLAPMMVMRSPPSALPMEGNR